jgi:MoxR-like ATPase
MSGDRETSFADLTAEELRDRFDSQDYVAEDEIVTTVLLALRLGKPLLIEGEPGAGKTELAKVLADGFDTDLVRLQCYEGLAAENALYEWNYTKQLLAVQAEEGGVTDDSSVFDEEFLLERPLLAALRGGETGDESGVPGDETADEHAASESDTGDDLEVSGRGDDASPDSPAGADLPPVLLIDEVDRADEEFEALLLEVLSDFQISIPELGTVSAANPPIVVITSNRTRTLSDALKRRCLYLHVSPPSFEKEREIVRRKVPQLDARAAAELCGITQRLREESLLKPPGVAETLDLGRALATLGVEDGHVDRTTLRNAIGTVLKDAEDVDRLDDETFDQLLDAARAASAESAE